MTCILRGPRSASGFLQSSLAGVTGSVAGITLMTSSSWAVMSGLLTILLALLFWMRDPLLLMVWVSETLILVWTHRRDLRQRPVLRPWLSKLFTRKNG